MPPKNRSAFGESGQLYYVGRRELPFLLTGALLRDPPRTLKCQLHSLKKLSRVRASWVFSGHFDRVRLLKSKIRVHNGEMRRADFARPLFAGWLSPGSPPAPSGTLLGRLFRPWRSSPVSIRPCFAAPILRRVTHQGCVMSWGGSRARKIGNHWWKGREMKKDRTAENAGERETDGQGSWRRTGPVRMFVKT